MRYPAPGSRRSHAYLPGQDTSKRPGRLVGAPKITWKLVLVELYSVTYRTYAVAE